MKNSFLMPAVAGLLCSIVLFGCGSTDSAGVSINGSTDSAGGSIKESTIYNKYCDIVSSSDPKRWDGFALIDLDGDGVKELFATCIDGEREDEGIQPYMIAGCNKAGNPIVNDEFQDGVAGAGGYRGMLYFIEGKGLLHESMVFAPLGLPADTIYELKDGMTEIKDQGEFSVDSYDDAEDDSWDPFEHGSWSWNGETVSEEKYYEMLKESTCDTEGSLMSEIDWKSKDAIFEELKKYTSKK